MYFRRSIGDYKRSCFVQNQRRTDYVDGVNNQGIDWCLGGAMPSKKIWDL